MKSRALKRISSIFFSLVFAVSLFSVSVFAGNTTLSGNDDSARGIGVFARFLDKRNINTVPIRDGSGEFEFPDGTVVTVDRVQGGRGRLVIDPVTEKEALDWFKDMMEGKMDSVFPFHIYYLNTFGHMLSVDGVTVSIKFADEWKQPVVFSLDSDEDTESLSAKVKGSEITIDTNGMPYYVFGEKPSGSLLPDETDKPDETAKPDETNKPDETAKPDETNKPDETTNPDETAKPDETNKPNETAKPSDTTKPGSSAKPSETAKPSGTTKPSGTAKPSGSVTSGTPKTQDDSCQLFWFCMLMVSSCILISIKIMDKKKA